MKRILEIRSLSLKPGTRNEFLRLFEQALPLQRQPHWGVDVVAYGLSLDGADVAYSIRAYEDLEQRQQSQDAFYGSPEWREGPREAIIACIESYVDTVMEVSEEAIASLRNR